MREMTFLILTTEPDTLPRDATRLVKKKPNGGEPAEKRSNTKNDFHTVRPWALL